MMISAMRADEPPVGIPAGRARPEVQIALAAEGDLEAITGFLGRHWRADHVFVTNPELLRWQHEFPGREKDALTYVLARRKGDGAADALVGLMGFMPFRRFDPAATWTEMALAIWKVRENAAVPGVGLRLHDAVIQMFRPDLVCAIGISAQVRPIYKALGYTLGQLAHVALFPNRATAAPRVAVGVPTEARRWVADDPGIVLLKVDRATPPDAALWHYVDALGARTAPRKSGRYVRERYLEHPWYEYQARAVQADGAIRALVIWRRVEMPLGAILRIVDVIGEAEVLGRCGAALRAEIEQAGGEYMDLMHLGVDVEPLRAAGFVSVADWQELILPNYFAPFVHRNVRIELAYRFGGELAGRRVRLFRADSDQDRPNDCATASVRRPGFTA